MSDEEFIEMNTHVIHLGRPVARGKARITRDGNIIIDIPPGDYGKTLYALALQNWVGGFDVHPKFQ